MIYLFFHRLSAFDSHIKILVILNFVEEMYEFLLDLSAMWQLSFHISICDFFSDLYVRLPENLKYLLSNKNSTFQ